MLSRALDKFYTNQEVALFCINRLNDCLKENNYNKEFYYIEPSAGAGHFYNLLPSNKIGIDIEPDHKDVMKMDFFKFSPNFDLHYVAIGNPPFGKNAALALRFLNHAAVFCDVVGFILPRTFQKPLWQNKIHRKLHCIDETILPDYSFNFLGQPYNVPSVFQIWHKKNLARAIYQKNNNDNDFAFVNSQEADFAFQRVGARAGLASVDGLKKSPSSHYFIKIINDNVPIFDILKTIDWSDIKYKTAGNPSIGKTELVNAYQDFKNKNNCLS